jgi:MraZ protein
VPASGGNSVQEGNSFITKSFVKLVIFNTLTLTFLARKYAFSRSSTGQSWRFFIQYNTHFYTLQPYQSGHNPHKSITTFLGYRRNDEAPTMGITKKQISVFHFCMTPKANMYLGQHHLFLKEEQHLIIPEAFRGLFEGGAYITRGFEQNLLIMSDRIFQELYNRIVSLNITDPLARLLLRLIIGNASRLEISASGHVLIPEDLRAFAGLEKEIIMVGQGNYFEVWAPADWEKQTTNLLDTAANSERFAQLDLALH